MAAVRAAAPVVADSHVRDAAMLRRFDADGGGASVLGGARQGFGDGVVRVARAPNRGSPQRA
ncbi:MAG TPA: hypothetical protein VMA72_26980 [Streptosporangiaceae bacterium]|nr:hypothetical protein [Streptosporangiaceae bacterium]